MYSFDGTKLSAILKSSSSVIEPLTAISITIPEGDSIAHPVRSGDGLSGSTLPALCSRILEYHFSGPPL